MCVVCVVTIGYMHICDFIVDLKHDTKTSNWRKKSLFWVNKKMMQGETPACRVQLPSHNSSGCLLPVFSPRRWRMSQNYSALTIWSCGLNSLCATLQTSQKITGMCCTPDLTHHFHLKNVGSSTVNAAVWSLGHSRRHNSTWGLCHPGLVDIDPDRLQHSAASAQSQEMANAPIRSQKYV